MELTPRTLEKGEANVVELLYYVKMFTNIIFSFFLDFGLENFELTPRTLGKSKVRVVKFFNYVRTFTFFFFEVKRRPELLER